MAIQGKLIDYQTLKKIKQLREAGKTIRDIVATTGVSSATVIKYIKQSTNNQVDCNINAQEQLDEIKRDIEYIKKTIETLKHITLTEESQKTGNIEIIHDIKTIKTKLHKEETRNIPLPGRKESTTIETKSKQDTSLFKTKRLHSDDIAKMIYRNGIQCKKDTIKTALDKYRKAGNEVSMTNEGYLISDIIEVLQYYNTVLPRYAVDFKELEEYNRI